MNKQKVLALVKKALRALRWRRLWFFSWVPSADRTVFRGLRRLFRLYVTRVIPVLGVATRRRRCWPPALSAAQGPAVAGRGTLDCVRLFLLFVAHGAYDEYLVPTPGRPDADAGRSSTPFRRALRRRPGPSRLLQMEAAAAQSGCAWTDPRAVSVYRAFVQAVFRRRRIC